MDLYFSSEFSSYEESFGLYKNDSKATVVGFVISDSKSWKYHVSLFTHEYLEMMILKYFCGVFFKLGHHNLHKYNYMYYSL